MRLHILVTAIVVSTSVNAYYDDSAGKPASKPLPVYCQMGECFVQTVEVTDPVLFGQKGVLVRVVSQNWHGDTSPKSLRRGADSTNYVLCSKVTPAVVDQTGDHKFMVTFLAPNNADFYAHSNETALALYFSVCHARAFGSALYEQGPVFAESIGYAVHPRDDQPTVDELEKVMDYAR